MPKASAGSHLIHHPLYDQWALTWTTARDVYEGDGGFMDPNRPYLVPHPREWLDHSVPERDSNNSIVRMVPNPSPSSPSPKLKMRRKLARYENMAAAILDTVTGSLFLEPTTRTVGSQRQDLPIQQWRANCDSKGTTLDAAMHDAWIVAAVFGHAILLLDKPDMESETAADTKLPILCRYTPLDLIDWLVDEYGQLTAVKLVEAAPRDDFGKRLTSNDIRVRIVDREKWMLYDKKGQEIESAEHGFGRLPVEILYGKRRVLTPVIGKSVMGDPQLYVDAYNLVSEVRELLRNQTFGVLNVPVGDQSVDREQAIIGEQSGTANVLFTTNQAQYLSPDGTNVTMYHEHIDRLSRMVYRLSAAAWEGDSRDAESGESRRLKRADMIAVLTKYTQEMARAEGTLTELFYRAMYGPERWEKVKDTEKPSTSYPTNFEPPDIEAVALRASEAIALDLGETATKEIKKRYTRVYLTGLDEEKQADIDKEIEAQTILTADEKQQQMLEQSAMRLTGKPPVKDEPPAPDDGRTSAAT